jgi:hypothetical protein
MGIKDVANVAIHVLRETKSYVDSCGGGSEFVVLDKNGAISRVAPFDVEIGETLSAAFVAAIRRLLVIVTDLETTPEKLREEFDLAQKIIEGCRGGQQKKMREHDAFFGILEKRAKGIELVDDAGERKTEKAR